MSTYRSPVINNRPPQVVDLGFYVDIRFDPDKDNPTYIGQHASLGASQDDDEWKITKLESDHIQIAYGSWTNRATYF